jgi:hypothetical protein
LGEGVVQNVADERGLGVVYQGKALSPRVCLLLAQEPLADREEVLGVSRGPGDRTILVAELAFDANGDVKTSGTF